MTLALGVEGEGATPVLEGKIRQVSEKQLT